MTKLLSITALAMLLGDASLLSPCSMARWSILEDSWKDAAWRSDVRVSPIEPEEPAAWQRSKAELGEIEKTGARHRSGIWGTIGRYLNPTEAEAIDQAKAAYGDDWAKVYNEQTKGQGIEGASFAEFVKGVPVAGALVKTTPAMEYLEKNYPTATAIERGMGSVAGTVPLIAARQLIAPLQKAAAALP
jgi:hypothetical protein